MKTNVRGALRLFIVATLFVAVSGKSQNLFVADYVNNVIDEFTPDGTESVFASGFSHPNQLTFDNKGNLFVSDDVDFGQVTTNGVVYKIAPDGTKTKFATGFYSPSGLAFDSTGNLYVTDSDFVNYIYKYSANGTYSVFDSSLPGAEVLATDRRGNLFAFVYFSTIYEFSTNGTPSVIATNYPNVEALAFDSAGNLYFNRNGVFGVYEIKTNGTIVTNINDNIGTPQGMAFDNVGNLFIAGDGNMISKLMPDGTLKTFSPPASVRTQYAGMAIAPVPRLQTSQVANSFQLTAVLPPAYFYPTIIQASSDLANWTNLYTNTPPFTFTDLITTASSRFYRAVLAP